MRGVAVVASAALVTGCFGYNPPARRWAYVGDTLLVLGGAGAVALDVTRTEEPCTGAGCPRFSPPFGGWMVTGVALATAGLVGVVINATRPTVKTSR